MPNELHGPAVTEAPLSDAEQAAVLDRWLHEFDVKQAALTARQDAFLREIRKSALKGGHDSTQT